MKKKAAKKVKATSSKRTVKTVKAVKSHSNKHVWGVDKEFILIVGGAFVLIVFGLMLFY